MNRRNKIAFALGVAAGLAFLIFAEESQAKTPAKTAAPKAAVAAAPPTKFVDKLNGFSIDLPVGWEQQKDQMGSAIMAISPMDGPKDSFRENINVVVESLKEKLTTKDYFQASQDVIKKVFTDFKSEKSGQTKIDGHDFMWTIFSHRLGTVRARVLQYVAVNKDKAYVITCSSEPDKFNQYMPKFEGSIKTFKF